MKTFHPLMIFLCLFVAAVLHTSCRPESNDAVTTVRDVNGNEIPTEDMEGELLAVMEKASVSGLSCTIINDSEIAYSKAFGFKNAEIGDLVDNESVFAAASFSKTVFSYLVLSLVEDGYLDLDTSLVQYLDSPISAYPKFADLAEDERHKNITARMVLSHTTGLPNSRLLMPESKLGFLFSPGERFSYSGEAFEFLQVVVEGVMGKGIEELCRERIFEPFGMRRTSYEWKDGFDENYALPHNKWMKPHFFRHRAASAAGSMVTTSADFARFTIGCLKAKASENGFVSQMFDTQVVIATESMFGPGAFRDSEDSARINLAWGLGWGLFDSSHGRAFFRTGHGNGAQNYTVVFLKTGTGIVLLSNSDNFESVAEEIIELTLGDSSSPYTWLGYVRFDTASVSEAPAPRNSVQVPEKVLVKYAGTYEMMDFDRTYFKVLDGNLCYSSDNKHWERMSAETPTRFFFRNFPYIYEFVEDNSGNVVGMDIVVEQWGLRIYSKKIG
jgi:D-alanyl-D-alanine-carboxypeptidase/D-alanyl-D-alanine-endopeptidase